MGGLCCGGSVITGLCEAGRQMQNADGCHGTCQAVCCMRFDGGLLLSLWRATVAPAK